MRAVPPPITWENPPRGRSCDFKHPKAGSKGAESRAARARTKSVNKRRAWPESLSQDNNNRRWRSTRPRSSPRPRRLSGARSPASPVSSARAGETQRSGAESSDTHGQRKQKASDVKREGPMVAEVERANQVSSQTRSRLLAASIAPGQRRGWPPYAPGAPPVHRPGPAGTQPGLDGSSAPGSGQTIRRDNKVVGADVPAHLRRSPTRTGRQEPRYQEIEL